MLTATALPWHPPPAAALIADCGHPRFPHWRIVLLLALLAVAIHTSDPRAFRAPRLGQRAAVTTVFKRAKQ